MSSIYTEHTYCTRAADLSFSLVRSSVLSFSLSTFIYIYICINTQASLGADVCGVGRSLFCRETLAKVCAVQIRAASHTHHITHDRPPDLVTDTKTTVAFDSTRSNKKQVL